MKALILAAGYATRLYPLTLDTPKALLPIGNKALLDYIMESLVKVPGMEEIHLVTNHRFAENFHNWANETREKYRELTPIIWDDGTTDNDNRRGAIGDMQFVIEQAGLQDDLLVAASDNFFTFDIVDFYNAFRSSRQDTLCATKVEDLEMIRGFAVAQLDDCGTVVDLEEKPKHPKSDLGVYALYLYRADTLPMINEYLTLGCSPDAPGHFPAWLYKRKAVHAFLFTGECVDVGTIDAYHRVQERYGNR